MIRIVIIEDERPAARRLSKIIESGNSNYQIECVLDSVESAIAWFQENPHPELIFADIQLGDGLSFCIFEQLKIESFVIFTTAYDEYAIKAFEHNSVDYLLKPIETVKLQVSLAKFERLKDKSPVHDMTSIIEFIAEEKKNYKTHFWVQIASRLQKIETHEIVFIQSTEKNTFANTSKRRSLMIDYSLDQLERILDPKQFFRINRQVIIQFSWIEQVEVLSKSRLLVKTTIPHKEELIVSQAKQGRFRQWLER